MRINEITQRLPTYQAQVRINFQTVTTQVQAANIMQARMLLQHLYGTANVVSLLAVWIASRNKKPRRVATMGFLRLLNP